MKVVFGYFYDGYKFQTSISIRYGLGFLLGRLFGRAVSKKKVIGSNWITPTFLTCIFEENGLVFKDLKRNVEKLHKILRYKCVIVISTIILTDRNCYKYDRIWYVTYSSQRQLKTERIYDPTQFERRSIYSDLRREALNQRQMNQELRNTLPPTLRVYLVWSAMSRNSLV